MQGHSLPRGGRRRPPGFLTVEQAAALVGMDAARLRDAAVLTGSPRCYGPFDRIPDSAFRILIDQVDAMAWNAAGRPTDARWRVPLALAATAFAAPPMPRHGYRPRARRPRPLALDPLLHVAIAALLAGVVGYLCGVMS